MTAIDLFAGAGGLTQGLKDAGFKVLAAVEIDGLAWESHRLNHPDVTCLQRDLWTFPPEELLAWTDLEPGALDLLAACPPCQGFSSVRTRNGSAVEDTRNDLVLRLLEFVKVVQPRAVLMENVPTLGSDARMVKLVEGLAELGYPADDCYRVLNANDYGVPQRRMRLVLSVARGSKVPIAPPELPRPTVRDALGSLAEPGASADPLHDLTESRSDRIKQLIAAIPKDGGSRSALGEDQQLPCHSNGFDGFKDVYGRMAWAKPAPTITGGCQSPSKGRYLHPSQDRTITLREAALLQGFPPGYRFSLRRGKLAAATMIGNALPPPFVAAQAREVARVLRVMSKLSQDGPPAP